MLGGTMSVNDKGHLMIGGCDTVELAHDYGTPLYVLDEQIMRQRARDYKMAFASFLPGSQVIYAGKALLTTAICRIIAQEQLGLDVVSGGELYTALAADFPTEHIYFHGNNKSPAELAMAIDHGIGRIVVDNLYELLLLQDLAASREVVVDILLRIAPGVEPHTHSYIQTGQY
ncbi:MAG: diaminopimelate decarboxylase, partial [Firmicutes bacterium]|nr:diaminopimelate decarboxylase [Bacillota bacterium]